MRVFAAAVVMLGFALIGCHADEDERLGSLFFERGVEGGLLISSDDGKIEFVYNRSRVETPYTPDATFFVPDVLIALEERAVTDEKQTLSWDGEDRGLVEWNRDQSLETAYRYSCGWFFVQIAGRIGKTRYIRRLKAMKFGNGTVGKDLSSFWVDGELEISARQQVDFLKSLYRETLPVKKESQQLLKQWMAVRRGANFVLYGKTAWAKRASTMHGWNIGFVESKNQGTWFFALNMMVEQASQAAFRQEIVYEALKRTGIIPR